MPQTINSNRKVEGGQSYTNMHVSSLGIDLDIIELITKVYVVTKNSNFDDSVTTSETAVCVENLFTLLGIAKGGTNCRPKCTEEAIGLESELRVGAIRAALYSHTR